MRNRGLEICMIGMWEHREDLIALLISQGIEDLDQQRALISNHHAICQSLPGNCSTVNSLYFRVLLTLYYCFHFKQ